MEEDIETWINSVDRGRLWHVNDNCVLLFFNNGVRNGAMVKGYHQGNE